jgi:ATP-binding cassette subfamily B multidrug efflux pump
MNHEFVERNRSLIRLNAVFHPALHALVGVMFVFVFYAGSHKLIAGTMTIGSFVAFQFYLGRLIWPLIALGWVINLFQRGMASMRRLHDIWSVEPATDRTAPVRDEAAPEASELEIRDLTFSYGHRPVLRDINLSVAHGRDHRHRRSNRQRQVDAAVVA